MLGASLWGYVSPGHHSCEIEVSAALLDGAAEFYGEDQFFLQ